MNQEIENILKELDLPYTKIDLRLLKKEVKEHKDQNIKETILNYYRGED